MIPSTVISIAAVAISLFSLFFTMYVRRRTFRPIVSAVVKTHAAGNQAIAYDLMVFNSGTVPAKNIRITAEDKSLAAALGRGVSEEKKKKWLAAFGTNIYLLHSNDRTSCSFGTTEGNDCGFWKYGATISISIRYEHWFRRLGLRRTYTESQKIQILDSDSFTGYQWGTVSTSGGGGSEAEA